MTGKTWQLLWEASLEDLAVINAPTLITKVIMNLPIGLTNTRNSFQEKKT